MKIERITCRVVDFPLEREFHPAWARGRNQPDLLMVLIEVGTDAGLTGLGAAHAGPEAAVTIERFVAPYFIGEDPMYVERLVPILRDTEILGAPVYCMEMPLWDIVGKAANLPVAKLWGGCSDGVTAYCATAEVRSPERRVEDVQRMLGEGYRAVKFRFHLPDPRADLKVVEAVRAAVGDRIDIMVDANQAGVASCSAWACAGSKSLCHATTTTVCVAFATNSTHCRSRAARTTMACTSSSC